MRTLSIKRRSKDGAAISLRLGTPIDGAKPFEVYGFAGSIGSLVAFAMNLLTERDKMGEICTPKDVAAVYISWAYVPESWLHALGITYYPSRYWAVAIPSYLMVFILFILALYTSLNFISTPSPQSLYTLCDDHTRPGMNLALSKSLDGQECPIIHPYSDIPIIEVNVLLLGPAFEQSSSRSYCRDRRAARIIQAAWRVHLTFPREKAKEYETKKTIIPPVYLGVTKKSYEMTPVIKIQRVWRSYVDKMTFENIRKDIQSYEKADPRTILLRINRSEATLVDKATGLHVRFRLNGLSFPPMVVYKVYTHRPVVDMGSFSPRQYAERTKNSPKTYIRCENNEWRPVVGTPAEQCGPKAVLHVPKLGEFFSNSLDERRMLKLLALKKRKRAWLRKLYTEGRAADCNKASNVDETSTSEPEFADLELMRWSAGLDFDEYERNWYMRALSLPEVYDKDWHKLGTCLPLYDVPVHPIPAFDTPSVFY